MLKKTAFAVLALALAGSAFAQETGEEPARKEPLHKIKVLEDPYDIASFYRSSQGGNGYFGMMPADPLSNRYPIASYYRNHQSNAGGGYGYGASQFWQSGYGARRGGIGFRRSIGENGDLFLFAPVFLAPLGPLSGAFALGF
jgi:hypothetical protein